MTLKIIMKSPGDRADYDIEYASWLGDGDRIVDVKASVDGDDNLKISDTAWTAAVAKIWVDGGSANKTAMINVTIKTLLGRIKNDCFKIRVRECSL